MQITTGSCQAIVNKGHAFATTGNEVILDFVKGFTAFVGLLQRTSNPINSTLLFIVQNCTTDTPITSSSLFA